MERVSRRKNEVQSEQESQRSACVHVCLFAFPRWRGERQWQLMASICAAKPNRQKTAIACLIWAVERPCNDGNSANTALLHSLMVACCSLPISPLVGSPFYCLVSRKHSGKWRKCAVERNMSALDTWLPRSRHCVNTNQQM